MLKTWDKSAFTRYKATGVLTNGKRFIPITSTNWYYIQSINLWLGHKWGQKPDGHWQLIQTVTP